MTTCLEDLKASIDAIALAVQQLQLETGDIRIALQVSADAQASSASSASAMASATSVSIAEAYAVALNFVDIDLRVEQTQVVNVMLPPVNTIDAPDIVDYPPEETGITDTPTTDNGSGQSQMCDAVVAVIRAIDAMIDALLLVPEEFWSIPSISLSAWELALKAAVFVNALLPVPKREMAGLSAYLAKEKAGGVQIKEILIETSTFLQVNEGTIANIAYCQLQQNANSYEASKAFQNWIAEQPLSLPAIAILAILFSPQAFAAMYYLPRWGVPVIGADCGQCGEI